MESGETTYINDRMKTFLKGPFRGGPDHRSIGQQGFIKASEGIEGAWGVAGSDPGGTSTTPPREIKQLGPNFQGVIRSCARLSSDI